MQKTALFEIKKNTSKCGNSRHKITDLNAENSIVQNLQIIIIYAQRHRRLEQKSSAPARQYRRTTGGHDAHFSTFACI